MKGKIFIDTNVFIYFFSPKDFEKKEISSNIIKASFKSDRFSISYQVIQEFSNVMLTKGQPPMKGQDISSFIEKILDPICSFFPTTEFYKNALKLREKNQLSYYDSLIVLAALELDCDYLFSEDFNDGAKINRLKIINPFNKLNAKLLKSIL
ncbi:PIN domain-containing protein [Leptospira meyeri]|uniref:PIN domain-containing protein n=1 Tax=Leptospira meyeri TaxID=29508 RepID=UPI0002BD90EA|nr:PIN domain-containing protein [Leptospira meyeri]EMJ88477.1 PIN domain protein [Leptospira meyeri serovar Semaranga str. Veldrot Semarang 173]